MEGKIVIVLLLDQKEINSYFHFLFRSLSAATDIIFIEAPRWKLEDFEKIAKGSIVPVINLRSIDSSTGVALAECLSLQEYYGFLRRLTVSYIGPGNFTNMIMKGRLCLDCCIENCYYSQLTDNNPLLNTYATLFPKLGMHFRYVCDGVN